MIELEETYIKEFHRLATPRAAAIAGILFGLLFAASLALIRGAIPAGISTDMSWVETGGWRIRVALVLMPFAGIAYLWFIGVVRDRLGDFEDKFFSLVFYGSSLRFLAISLGLVFLMWLGQIYFATMIVLVSICLWKLVDILRLWYEEKTADRGERKRNEAAMALSTSATRALIIMVGLIMTLNYFRVKISQEKKAGQSC